MMSYHTNCIPPCNLKFSKTSLNESLQPSDETNAGAARKSHFVITVYFSLALAEFLCSKLELRQR